MTVTNEHLGHAGMGSVRTDGLQRYNWTWHPMAVTLAGVVCAGMLTALFWLVVSVTELRTEVARNIGELRTDIALLQDGQERLEASQALLQASQERLETSQALLQASQERLEASQTLLQASQERLEASQALLQASQERLEDGQKQMATEIAALRGDMAAILARLPE